MAMTRPVLPLSTSSYAFVDWATQIYTALVAILILLFHNGSVPHWQALVAGHVLCLIAVHALVNAKPGNRALHFVRHFYPVLLYTAFFRETGELNRMFFTEYMDPLVIGWEQRLFGFQPSVLFMERLPYAWLSEVLYLSYFSYYIMIAGVGLALLARDRQQFFHFVSVVSFVFYLCYLTYIVIPVIGPRVLFREVEGYQVAVELQSFSPYPEAVTKGVMFRVMAWIYHVFEAPGAAFPSSHVAVALCTVWFSFRYLPRIRYLHAAMAGLLCISTVYCRYHYVLDVFAGIFTAAILVPAGNYFYERFRHIGHNSPAGPLSPVADQSPASGPPAAIRS